MKPKKKKVVKKVSVKRKVRKKAPVLHKSKKKPETDSSSIFDSSLGKTDALFVNEPEQNNLPESRASIEIDEVLKELEATQEIPPEASVTPDVDKNQNSPLATEEKKKPSFWKRLFVRNNNTQ